MEHQNEYLLLHNQMQFKYIFFLNNFLLLNV